MLDEACWFVLLERTGKARGGFEAESGSSGSDSKRKGSGLLDLRVLGQILKK